MGKTGLIPPDWRTRKDPLAPVQDYLYSRFQDFVTRCPPLDVLCIVGDIFDGTIQVRARPRGVGSDDPDDQFDAAVETLGPLVEKAKKTYLIRGTPFHEGGDEVERLGRELKTVKWASCGRRHSGHILNLNFAGRTFNVSHHQTRGWMWLGGAASRTAVLAAAAEAAEKAPRADVIVRGDLHCKVRTRTLGKWILFLPAWKMPDLHAIKSMEAIRAHLATDIGGEVMCIEDQFVGFHDDFEYPLFKQSVVTA